MNTASIVALVGAATAFLTAAAHVAADISGVMDRFRKVPIQSPTGQLPAPPAAPPAAPPGPPAGL